MQYRRDYKMTEKVNTVKKLYFILIMISAISTIYLFNAVIHFCCHKRAILSLPYNTVPIGATLKKFKKPIALGLAVINKDKNLNNELEKNLKYCTQARRILVVNVELEAPLNTTNAKPRFIFKTENLPSTFKKAKQLKPLNTAKKHRGFYFVSSFSGDQLSAATRRIFWLNALATYGKRLVVEPLVKSSLFYGDQLSRIKPPLKSLSLYYNMTYLNKILGEFGYSKFASRQQFVSGCRSRTGSLYVRLLPNQWLRNQMNIKPNIASWVKQTTEKGWLRCNLPLSHLKYYSLMSKLRVVRQICVNTDTVHNFSKLEDEIFHHYKCVVFHHWGGTGKLNGNYFQPQSPLILPPLELSHLLTFSSEIVDIARRFISYDLRGLPYISVHIRTERFFRTNPNFAENFARLRNCGEYLVTLVKTLKKSSKIDQVFVASDLGELGSSAIESVLARVSDKDAGDVRESMRYLMRYQKSLVARLNPVRRLGSKTIDKGIEALVDMSILKNADHLVTVGTGMTWQLWVMDVFIQRQEERKRRNYSVIKLC